MSELVETRLATLEEKVAVLASQNAALQTEVLHLRAAVADSGKVRKNEDYYQSLLSARMNAGHMSITGVGTTDITTADAHIEIKKWSGYHEVIGQLAKYNRAVKRPRLCVYFFGPEPKKERYEQILDLMAEANIEMYSVDAGDGIVRHERVSHEQVTAFREFASKHITRIQNARLCEKDLRVRLNMWETTPECVIQFPESKTGLREIFVSVLGPRFQNQFNGISLTGWKHCQLVQDCSCCSMPR